MGFHDSCSWEGAGVSRRRDRELGAGRSAAGRHPGGAEAGAVLGCVEVGPSSFREILPLGMEYRKRAADEWG